jgi:hypothetical protein
MVLAVLFSVALATAAAASARSEWKRGSAQSVMVLAERTLQHDAHWAPTSIYCLPPRRSAYAHVAGAVEKTFRCQWVKQNNSRPWEIDTVQMVYGSSGRYLFSLVASNYAPPRVRPALCRVSPAGRGFRTACHPK